MQIKKGAFFRVITAVFFLSLVLTSIASASNQVLLKAISRIENGKEVGAVFYKDGKSFFQRYGYGRGRGINFAVLHPVTGEIEDIQNFDNWYSMRLANEAMVKFIDNIPSGHIVMAAIADEGSAIFETTHQKLESALGAKQTRNIKYWDNWAIISKKGLTNSIAELYSPKDQSCVIEVNLELSAASDHTPPSGSFLINNGTRVTDNSEVELNLSGIIDSESGMGQGARMSFSNGGKYWSTPEFFKPAKKWYMERGAGTKTIYAKFADISGNWNQTPITSRIKLIENVNLAEFQKSAFYRSDIAEDKNGNLYAVWSGKNTSDDKVRIYFNCSRDNGMTWFVSPKVISASTDGWWPEPKITCDDFGHVYISWYTGRSAGNNLVNMEVYLISSSDFGATWQANPIKLDNISSNDKRIEDINVVCDNKADVYLVWSYADNLNGIKDYYFSCSRNYGISWLTDKIKINKTSLPDYYSFSSVSILCDERGGVYIFWKGRITSGGSNKIIYNYSFDYGLTWQDSDIVISKGESANGSPKIGRNGDNLFVVWPSSGKISFQSSFDRGKAWLEKDREAVNNPNKYIYNIDMQNDDSGNIYLTWTEDVMWHTYPSKQEVYFNCSRDYGLNWLSQNIRVATGPYDLVSAYNPRIACNNKGSVYVVYSDDRNYTINNRFLPQDSNYNIDNFLGNLYLNYSKDYGATWLSNDIRLDKGYETRVSRANAQGKEIICDENDSVFTLWSELFSSGGTKNVYLYEFPAASVNQSPELSSIGDKTVSENSNLNFTISATDPDGDSLTYSVSGSQASSSAKRKFRVIRSSSSGLPKGAKFDSTTHVFDWTPDYDQAGSYNITFTVSDGKLTNSETSTITVSNVNRPPKANLRASRISGRTHLTVNFNAKSSKDPDGDTLTYFWSFGDGETSTSESPTHIFGNKSWRANRIYDVTLTVTDPSGASSTETISIKVYPWWRGRTLFG